MNDAYPTYRTKVFIDSNVVLEAKRLSELPWSEIDSTGPILVLVLPTVLNEVDGKKRDGRLAKKAREFNRLLSPLLGGCDVVRVISTPVQVDLAIAHCGRIDWDQLNDLDPRDGDHRVVAELLHVSGVPLDQRVIVGQDIKPLLLAKRHGMRTIHVPESWLPAPEAGPLEKQVERLRQQVRDYERSEPEFEASLRIQQPVSTLKVSTLTENQSRTLLERILEENPEPSQPHTYLSMGRDVTLNDRYAKYESERLPEFVRGYSEKLELMFCQALISLRVESTGNLRADRVLIRVRVVGGWFNDKPIWVPADGPSPPRARWHDPLRHMRLATTHIPRRVGKHEFDVDPPKRDVSFEVRCEDFRHGTRWQFDGIVWLDPHFTGTSRVIVEVTAANLHGKFEKVFPIERKVEDVTVSQLVGDDWKYIRRPPIQDRIDAILKSEDYGDLELDGASDD